MIEHKYLSYCFGLINYVRSSGDRPMNTVERHLITVEHTYQDVQVSLQAYLCHADSDEFTLREHVAYQWLTASTMDSVDWADADVEIVREVRGVIESELVKS